MNRCGILVLAAVLVLGVAAAWLTVCLSRHDGAPMEWLRHEFALDDRTAARVEKMHVDYEEVCMEMCRDIERADARLSDLMRASREVTSEIRAAIAETDRVRTACRTNMLEHFYRIAAELPANQRDRYMRMVLPAVLDPDGIPRSMSPSK